MVADLDAEGDVLVLALEVVRTGCQRRIPAVDGDELIVGDTANSRLVGWSEAGIAPPASGLTGQSDFASKGDNGWGIARRDSVCWPYGLSARGGLVAIADSGNNRVLLWKTAS